MLCHALEEVKHDTLSLGCITELGPWWDTIKSGFVIQQ